MDSKQSKLDLLRLSLSQKHKEIKELERLLLIKKSELERLEKAITVEEQKEIKRKNLGEVVLVNDTVLLNLDYGNNDISEETYTIVYGDGDIRLKKISVESPLGSAVYNHRVGETVPFTVGQNTFHAQILKKIKK